MSSEMLIPQTLHHFQVTLECRLTNHAAGEQLVHDEAELVAQEEGSAKVVRPAKIVR
jgi:hypothetical protein